MDKTSLILSRVPLSLQRGLKDYVASVVALTGTHLDSLCIFGPVLTPDWKPFRRVHQVMVLATDDLELIARLSVLATPAVKLGLVAPLLISSEFIGSSLDTFPLEWLEISHCHEVLHGNDPFQNLVFTREHVRLQCERECAVLCISVRQRMIQGQRSVNLPLTDLADHALRILGGLLYIDGQAVPCTPTDLISVSARILNLDLKPIIRAWNGEKGISLLRELHQLFNQLEARSDRV